MEALSRGSRATLWARFGGFNWTGTLSPHPRVGELQGLSLPLGALCTLPGPGVTDARELHSWFLQVRDVWLLAPSSEPPCSVFHLESLS